MTNVEFSQMLRNLADIYEAQPELPQLHSLREGIGSEFIFCHTKEVFANAVRAFGAGAKDADADGLIFRPEGFPMLKIYGFKSNLCERVQIGTQVIPATEEQIIPAQPEREVPVYEWHCAPFLDNQEQDETTTESKEVPF